MAARRQPPNGATMISERKATSIRALAGGEIAISFEGDAPNVARASLLLDSAGHLVGVDLGGEGFGRTVVMLGPHEAVDSQRDSTVQVGVGELRLPASAVPLPNPYLR